MFDTGFGIAWFAGSAAMGLLHDKSIPALILFSIVLQLAALPGAVARPAGGAPVGEASPAAERRVITVS